MEETKINMPLLKLARHYSKPIKYSQKYNLSCKILSAIIYVRHANY